MDGEAAHVTTQAPATRDLPDAGHAQPSRIRDPLQRPPLPTQLQHSVLTNVRDRFQLEVELREEVVDRPHHHCRVPQGRKPGSLVRQGSLELW